jgi:hypothetical protein
MQGDNDGHKTGSLPAWFYACLSDAVQIIEGVRVFEIS